MALIDYTSTIGIVFGTLNTMTGSTFLSLLFVFLVLFFICLGFRLPMELSVPLAIPFVVTAIVATSDFLQILAACIVIVAFFIIKVFV